MVQQKIQSNHTALCHPRKGMYMIQSKSEESTAEHGYDTMAEFYILKHIQSLRSFSSLFRRIIHGSLGEIKHTSRVRGDPKKGNRNVPVPLGDAIARSQDGIELQFSK